MRTEAISDADPIVKKKKKEQKRTEVLMNSACTGKRKDSHCSVVDRYSSLVINTKVMSPIHEHLSFEVKDFFLFFLLYLFLSWILTSRQTHRVTSGQLGRGREERSPHDEERERAART